MIIGLSLSYTRLLVNHLKVKMWRPIYRMTTIGVRVLCVCGVHTKIFFDYSRQRGTEPHHDCILDNRLIIEKKRDIRTSRIFIFLSIFFSPSSFYFEALRRRNVNEGELFAVVMICHLVTHAWHLKNKNEKKKLCNFRSRVDIARDCFFHVYFSFSFHFPSICSSDCEKKIWKNEIKIGDGKTKEGASAFVLLRDINKKKSRHMCIVYVLL